MKQITFLILLTASVSCSQKKLQVTSEVWISEGSKEIIHKDSSTIVVFENHFDTFITMEANGREILSKYLKTQGSISRVPEQFILRIPNDGCNVSIVLGEGKRREKIEFYIKKRYSFIYISKPKGSKRVIITYSNYEREYY